LKYIIGKHGTGYDGVVQRGVELSNKELDVFRELKDSGLPFYIPSFTSASTTQPFQKNSIMKIKMQKNTGFAIAIEKEWTKYPQENEVLLSCYNVFKITSMSEENGKNVICMDLLDYREYHDDFRNSHSLVTGPIPRGSVSLRSRCNLKYLGILEIGQNGTKVKITGNLNHLWQIVNTDDGGWYTIQHLPTGLFLNVCGGIDDNGTDIQLYNNPKSPHSQWKFVYEYEVYFSLWNRHTGKCVNVSGGGLDCGTRIQQWDNPYCPHSQWMIEKI